MSSKNKSVIYSTSQITKTLLDLMETKSFNDINISEICKKADLTRPTFYNHYKDKEEVLSLYIDELWMGIVLNKTSESLGTNELLNLFFKECLINKSFISLLINNNLLYLFIERFSKRFIDLYDIADFSYKPKTQLEKELGVAFISYSLAGIVSYWVVNKTESSSDELVLIVERLLRLKE